MINTSANASFSLATTVEGTSWVRLEQLKESEEATMEETAKLVDEMYSIDPCKEEQELSDEPPEYSAPTIDELEENFQEAVSSSFGLPSCDSARDGSWLARVAIWKSDPELDHVIRVVGGEEFGPSENVSVAISKTFDVSGASSVSLEASVIGEGAFYWLGNAVNDAGGSSKPKINLTGTTLWWEGSVTGVIAVRYNSEYTLVNVLVAAGEQTTEEIVQGDCTVWCFCSGVSDVLELEAPSISSLDTGIYCDGGQGEKVVVPKTEKPLWRSTTTEYYCQCSNSLAYKVKSPEPTPAELLTHVYPGVTERVHGGFVDCNERDPDLSSPEYFLDKCCEPPYHLVDCRETYRKNPGGKELSVEVKQEYINRFAPRPVAFVPVAPADGDCGNIVTSMRMNALTCCDFVEPLVWDTDNSAEVIADNSSGIVRVTGGKLPLTVSVRGNGFWLDGARSIRDGIVDGQIIRIYTSDACGVCEITISDGCSDVVGGVRATNGQWTIVQYIHPPSYWLPHWISSGVYGGYPYNPNDLMGWLDPAHFIDDENARTPDLSKEGLPFQYSMVYNSPAVVGGCPAEEKTSHNFLGFEIQLYMGCSYLYGPAGAQYRTSWQARYKYIHKFSC